MIWPAQDKPAIITANHTSLLDGPALAWLAPRPILFAVDPAFAAHRFWRPALLTYATMIGTGCHMVAMEPGSPRGLRALLRELQAGGWVCLFPEGGIGTGRRYPGVDWLARRADAPVHELRIETRGWGKLRWPVAVGRGVA